MFNEILLLIPVTLAGACSPIARVTRVKFGRKRSQGNK